MHDVTEEGRTVLFVSHNLAAIRRLCPRTIWIDRGRIAMDGATDDVLPAYLKASFQEEDAGVVEGEELRKKTESYLAPHPLFLPTRIAVSDADGLSKTSFRSDEDIVLSLAYDVFKPVMNLRIVVALVDEDGRIIMHTENLDHPSAREFYMTEPGSYSSQCVITKDMLGDQRFWVDVNMICENVQHVRVERGLHFDVAFQPYNDNFSPHVGQGFLRPQLTWRTEAAPPEAGSPPVNLRERRARRD
jgi:lipopolysaccharide transport system ATP-binding protein